MSLSDGLGVIARINALPCSYEHTGRFSAEVINAICDVCEERRQVVQIDSESDCRKLNFCGGCLRKLAENV